MNEIFKKPTSALKRQGIWLKPLIVLFAMFMFFTATDSYSNEVVENYSPTTVVQNVDAFDPLGWGAKKVKGAWRWLSRANQALWNTQEAATEITSGTYEGMEWSILHPDIIGDEYIDYSNEATGAARTSGGNAPFKDVGDITESDAAPFMAFQYWASTYGIYSGYEGISDAMSQIFTVAGRKIGGYLIQFVAYIGRIVQLAGVMVYTSIEKFNIFYYITPDTTEDGTLLSAWVYRTDPNGAHKTEGIFNYFAHWLNSGRYIGYLIALVLFVSGLALTVFGVRIGKSQTMTGSFLATINRLLVSVFALTGAIFMLSGIITMFADSMRSEADSFDIDHQIAGLILNYEGFVTANYDMGDGDNNNTWMVNNGYETSEKAMGSETLDSIIQIYSGGGSPSTVAHSGTISSEEIRRMNIEAGSYDPDYLDNAADYNALDYIRMFSDFPASYLISGWASNSINHSSDMSARYGDQSMPYAIYRVKTKEGDMKIENGGLFSRGMTFYDYTLPGGFAGFSRYIGVIGSILLISIFSMYMYWYMFQSIMGMISRSLVYLPTAIGLGSLSSLFILFGTVITMMVQIVFARMMISLFKNMLNFSYMIFPSLIDFAFNRTPTSSTIFLGGDGIFNLGVIFPFGDVVTTGDMVAEAISTWILGILLIGALKKLNENFGSSVESFFSDMALRIAGIRRGPQQGSGAGADGTMESTTVSETDANSTIGSFEESEAASMGLGGSILGGVGSSSGFGSGTGQHLADGYGTDSEEDVDRLNDGDLSSESALASDSDSEESMEEGLGAVGYSDSGSSGALGTGSGMEEEEEVNVSESSASGSSSSGTSDGIGSAGSAVSDDRDFEEVADSTDDALGETNDSDENQDSERTIGGTERVVSDMDSEFDEMDTDIGTPENMDSADDDVSDSERTIGGTDRVVSDSDQEYDDMDSQDSIGSQSASDRDLQGEDSIIAASAGNVDIEADSSDGNIGGYDVSDDSSLGDDLDEGVNNQDMSIIGADDNIRYNMEEGEQSLDSDLGQSDSSGGYNIDDISSEGSSENEAVNRTVDNDGSDIDVITDVTGDGEMSINDSNSNQDTSDLDYDINAYDLNTDSNTSGIDLDDIETQSMNNESLSVNNQSSIIDNYNIDSDGSITREQDITEGTESMVDKSGVGGGYDATPSTESFDADDVSIADERLDNRTQQSVVGDISGVSQDEVRMDQSGEMTHQVHMQEGSDQLQENHAAKDTFEQNVSPVSSPNEASITDHNINDSSQSRDVSNVAGVNDETIIIDTDGQIEARQIVNDGGYSVGSSESSQGSYSGSGSHNYDVASTGAYNVADTSSPVSNSPSISNGSMESSPASTGGYESANASVERSRSARVEQHDFKNKTTTTTKYTPGSGASGGVSGTGGIDGLDGGYIDNDGNFQRSHSSPLSSDFDRIISSHRYEGNSSGKSQQSAAPKKTAVPRTRRSPMSPGSYDVGGTGSGSDVSPGVTSPINRGSSSPKDVSVNSEFSGTKVSNTSSMFDNVTTGTFGYDVGGKSSNTAADNPSYSTSEGVGASNSVSEESTTFNRTTDVSTRGQFGQRNRPTRTVESGAHNETRRNTGTSSSRNLRGLVSDEDIGLFGQRTAKVSESTNVETVEGSSSYNRESSDGKAPLFGRRD